MTGSKIISDLDTTIADPKQTGKSEEYALVCAACARRKCWLNIDKRQWICYYCGTGGGIRRLYAAYGLEYDGTPDLRRLRATVRQPLVKAEPKESKGLPPGYRRLPDSGLIAKAAMRYLRGRGITDAEIEAWAIGYCVSGACLGMIVIPITDQDGNVVSYQARRFIGSGPKSYNPPGDGGVLFNLHAARGLAGAVLVEGPFDSIKAHGHLAPEGIGVVALMGHACSTLHAAIVRQIINPEIAWVLLDPDLEAEDSHRVGAKLLSAGVPDVRIAYLSTDPDEADKATLLDALEAAIPTNRA